MKAEENTNKCIIVVDIQNGFINEESKELPHKIKNFLDGDTFTHRVFTRFINPGKDGPFYNIMNWKRFTDENDNPEIEIVKELLSYSTLIIDKYNYSPFNNNAFKYFLLDNNIKEAYICGINTEVCVAITAMEIFSHNVKAIVLENLCGSVRGIEYHKNGLRVIERMIGLENVQIADFN